MAPFGGWQISAGGVKNIVKNKVFGMVGALGSEVSCRTDSGTILGRFLTDLGSILRRSWADFWSIFGRSWVDVNPILMLLVLLALFTMLFWVEL